MKKQHGLLHIPDLVADTSELPGWYAASDVDAIFEDVLLWLRLDRDIRHRLELPHGWDAIEVGMHRNELRMRDEVRDRLKSSL